MQDAKAMGHTDPSGYLSKITTPTPYREVSAAGVKGNEESSAKTRDEARLT